MLGGHGKGARFVLFGLGRFGCQGKGVRVRVLGVGVRMFGLEVFGLGWHG